MQRSCLKDSRLFLLLLRWEGDGRRWIHLRPLPLPAAPVWRPQQRWAGDEPNRRFSSPKRCRLKLESLQLLLMKVCPLQTEALRVLDRFCFTLKSNWFLMSMLRFSELSADSDRQHHHHQRHHLHRGLPASTSGRSHARSTRLTKT